MATNAREKDKATLASLQSSHSSSASDRVKRHKREKEASGVKSHSSRSKNHSQAPTMGASNDLAQKKTEAKQLRNDQDKAIKRLEIDTAKSDNDNVDLGTKNSSLLTHVYTLTEESGIRVAENLSLSEDKKTLEREKEALKKVVEDLKEKDRVTQKRMIDLEGGMGENSPGLTVDLKHTLSSLETNMVELTAHYNVVVESEKELKKNNQQLVERLRMALAELKKDSKSCPFERSKDFVDELKDYVGTTGYRECKFVHNEDQVQQFLGECYDYLVQKMPKLGDPTHEDYVSKEDFRRIYEPVAITKLNSRRQFSQTQMLEAVKSES